MSVSVQRGVWGGCVLSCSVWVVALSGEAIISMLQPGAAASPSLWEGRRFDCDVRQTLKLLIQVLGNCVVFINLTVTGLGIFDWIGPVRVSLFAIERSWLG